eukprot:5171805-Amphidinium_carterae.1
MRWGVPLLHMSRTQSTIALSSAEAELYAMGQATIESQHVKQVIEEMGIPEMDTNNVTMMINTDSSSGKAVASRLGLNRKTKHVQLKFLYIQDVIQRGELTIKKIPTTHDPADVLTKHLPAITIQSHLERLCLHTSTTTTVATVRGVHSTTITIGMITQAINNEENGGSAEARAIHKEREE